MSHEDKGKNDYYTEHVQALSACEHVRLRPGMYIGGVDEHALHNLIEEVIAVSMQQARLGLVREIIIRLQANQRVVMRDDGVGLPVSLHEKTDKPFLEVAMTALDENKLRFMHGEFVLFVTLYGVSFFAVNALSSRCVAESRRDGYLWRQTYVQGIPTSEVERVRPLTDSESTGMTITFQPDFTIFDQNYFDYVHIQKRLRELAYIGHGVKITLIDERNAETVSEVFQSSDGLADYVQHLNRAYTPLHPVLSAEKTVAYRPQKGVENLRKIRVATAMQYIQESDTLILNYVNEMEAINGGTPEEALINALGEILMGHALERELVTPIISRRRAKDVFKDVVRQGLTCVIVIQHPDPNYSGAMPYRLTNEDVHHPVSTAVHSMINSLKEKDAEALNALVERIVKRHNSRLQRCNLETT